MREVMRQFDKLHHRLDHQISYQMKDSTNKKQMKTLGVMMKKLLDADTQVLVKAGYINGDLELTNEGTTALDSILFDTAKPALVALANAKLEEEKKK